LEAAVATADAMVVDFLVWRDRQPDALAAVKRRVRMQRHKMQQCSRRLNRVKETGRPKMHPHQMRSRTPLPLSPSLTAPQIHRFPQIDPP